MEGAGLCLTSLTDGRGRGDMTGHQVTGGVEQWRTQDFLKGEGRAEIFRYSSQ